VAELAYKDPLLKYTYCFTVVFAIQIQHLIQSKAHTAKINSKNI